MVDFSLLLAVKLKLSLKRPKISEKDDKILAGVEMAAMALA